MKKILLFLMCAVLLISVFSPLQVLASDVAETPAVEDAAEDKPAMESETAEKIHTIWSRVLEYCETYPGEVLTAVVGFLVTLTGVINKIASNKGFKNLTANLQSVAGETSLSLKNQKDIVGVVSQLITAYNETAVKYEEMKAAYDKQQGAEDDRNRLTAAVMVQNTAIMEVLHAVYINNKNIPQSTKDYMNQRMANSMKVISNDEKLRAVIEAMRETINDGCEEESAEAEAEEVAS